MTRKPKKEKKIQSQLVVTKNEYYQQFFLQMAH
jgi:hypothetical protein